MEDLKNILPANMYEVIEKAGILTSKEILTLSIWDLKKITNMTDDDIYLLKNIVSKYACPLVLSGNKLQPDEYISSGCLKLDSFLKGGFRKGSLSEIYGESGTGKTQLALQIAAKCGQDGCVYICTEDIFPVKRFYEISERIYHPHSFKHRQNMFIEHVIEAPDFLSCIRVRLPILLNKNKISVIIVDSIAAPFRCEDSNYIQRAEQLRELALSLLSLVEKYNIAIICVNQVTSSIDDSNEVLPALGLAWSNLVTNRILLKRTSNTITSQGAKFYIRELVKVFSPSLCNSVAKLIINNEGIKSL